MNARDQASAAGALTYTTGKPCKAGHISERYVSNGMCIMCLKKYSNERTHNIIRKNLMNGPNMVRHAMAVKKQYIKVLDDITDFMVEDGHRAALLAQFILMIGDSALLQDDVRRLLIKDADGIVRNPVRSGHAGFPEVELMGEWYLLGEVREVEQGKRDRVVRVRPPVTINNGRSDT